MRRLLILITAAVVSLLNGCAGPRGSRDHDHVDLIEHGDGDLTLLITKRQWDGVLGSHGYAGYVSRHYKAHLHGNGPTFRDPKFQDNPPSIRCVGTIIIDRNSSTAIVDMRRVTSPEGAPLVTELHPANGRYALESVRKARPGEAPF